MDSKKDLLLVINPISGGSEKEDLITSIKEIIAKRNHDLTIFKTTGTSDEEKIDNLLSDHKFDFILVAGGDGTIQLVARAVIDKGIPLGLIPAGSANGLASNLNIPTTLEAQIDIALGTDFMRMDVISINDHLCLHIADLGINASLIKNYENATLRGKLGYALQTIPTLVQADLPYHFSVEINGATMALEGVMLAIANANQFGTGAVINPEGKMDDGLFEILIFKNLNVIDILKTLNKDAERDSDFVECFQATNVKITCKNKVALQIDGEYIGETKHVTAALISSKLKIMIPKR